MTAFPSFDPAKHRRDLLGRFASKGNGNGEARQRFRLGSVLKVRTTTEGYSRRSTAKKPSVPEGEAREQWRKYTNEAHEVHREFSEIGQVKRRYLKRTWDALTDEPLSLHEAMREPLILHLRRRGVGRVASKRTVKGDAVVERGYGAPYITSDHFLRYPAKKSRLRNFAGKKDGAARRRIQVRQVGSSGYTPRHSAD